MLLVSLVGEQPIPNLLPIKHLCPDQVLLVHTADTEAVAKRMQRMLGSADLVKVLPYDLGRTLEKLQRALGDKAEVLFNVTGGTKPMALAAYALAAQRQAPFIYLQSQGHASLLFRYLFQDGTPILAGEETLPTLITIDEYLRAHLPGYRAEGFSHDEHDALTDGGQFERAICEALAQRGLEVLPGVRPEGVANQIEIDLVIRLGNQVGIAEVKLGDVAGKGPKAGLDQLAMVGSREYLGTYAERFLITARRLPDEIATLARAQRINLVELPRYRGDDTLAREDANYLERAISAKLGGRRP